MSIASDSEVRDAHETVTRRRGWLAFGDLSRRRRLVNIGGWLGGVALALGVLDLPGVDVRGWCSDSWDALTRIPLEYILSGFTVAGTFVYVYLFLSVPSSFEPQLNGLHDHPLAVAGILAGAALLLVVRGRIFWEKLEGVWEEAKRGGAILARPWDYAWSGGAAVVRRVAGQARWDQRDERRAAKRTAPRTP
jgi:hypothetical protein